MCLKTRGLRVLPGFGFGPCPDASFKPAFRLEFVEVLKKKLTLNPEPLNSKGFRSLWTTHLWLGPRAQLEVPALDKGIFCQFIDLLRRSCPCFGIYS